MEKEQKVLKKKVVYIIFFRLSYACAQIISLQIEWRRN